MEQPVVHRLKASGAQRFAHHASVMQFEHWSLGLMGLALISCSHNGGAAKTPASTGTASLELQHGPPPQLPSPMMVADSVHGGAFETCYQSFHPTGNAKNDLIQMTSLCGKSTSMKAVTPVLEGTQSQSDPIARYTFHGELGRCYRIFSASDRGVRDLDMAILDPTHAVIGHDTNEDAFPILNPDGPLCLTRPGAYTVLVSVERGTGHYALQVWGF
jgi:hypothetical protein